MKIFTEDVVPAPLLISSKGKVTGWVRIASQSRTLPGWLGVGLSSCRPKLLFGIKSSSLKLE